MSDGSHVADTERPESSHDNVDARSQRHPDIGLERGSFDRERCRRFRTPDHFEQCGETGVGNQIVGDDRFHSQLRRWPEQTLLSSGDGGLPGGIFERCKRKDCRLNCNIVDDDVFDTHRIEE